MTTVVNGLDRSFNTPTVNAFWSRVNDPKRLILIAGRDNLKDRISSMKETAPASATGSNKRSHTARGDNSRVEFGKYRYIEAGVSVLKAEAYKAMKIEDNVDRDMRGVLKFPNDYDEEYFKQLTAEIYEINATTRKGKWKKTRNRNEALDMHVYNVAMGYYLGVQTLTDEDYDAIERQFNIKKVAYTNMNRRAVQTRTRIVSAGGVY